MTPVASSSEYKKTSPLAKCIWILSVRLCRNNIIICCSLEKECQSPPMSWFLLRAFYYHYQEGRWSSPPHIHNRFNLFDIAGLPLGNVWTSPFFRRGGDHLVFCQCYLIVRGRYFLIDNIPSYLAKRWPSFFFIGEGQDHFLTVAQYLISLTNRICLIVLLRLSKGGGHPPLSWRGGDHFVFWQCDLTVV